MVLPSLACPEPLATGGLGVCAPGTDSVRVDLPAGPAVHPPPPCHRDSDRSGDRQHPAPWPCHHITTGSSARPPVRLPACYLPPSP